MEFICVLLKQKTPIKNRVFFLSLSDLSELYFRLSLDGRANSDARNYGALKLILSGIGIMFFAGSGVFLFFFFDQEPTRIIPLKKKMLETIFGLIGHGPSNTGSGSVTTGDPVADIDGMIGSAFRNDFDVDAFIKRSINTIGDKTLSSSEKRTQTAGISQHIFEGICRQVRFKYTPVWNTRTQMVAIYRLDATREIDRNIILGGNSILTRGAHDPYHYKFQIYKINHAFSEILSWESQNCGGANAPCILVPFSYASMTEVLSDDFENDLRAIFGFHTGPRLSVLISDVDEGMPLRLFNKTMKVLSNHKIGIFVDMPLTHPYYKEVAKLEDVTTLIDVNALIGLGFDPAITETLLREFATRVAAQRGQSMISNADNSIISGIAYKAGYQFISGKIVGPDRATIDQITKIPTSRILLKS